VINIRCGSNTRITREGALLRGTYIWFIVEKHNKHTIAKVQESTNRHGGKNVTITE